MPAWLKKIVLDIMPSVAATIIGAYVVNYYIIPKSPSAGIRASIGLKAADVPPDEAIADPKPIAEKTANEKSAAEKSSIDKTSIEKDSFEKAVADKTAIEKTAEKIASDKAAAEKVSSTAAIEPRKQAPKLSAKPASVAATEPVSDDRRNTNQRATDLARAAIERLRGSGHAEPTKSEMKPPELAKATDVPRVQTVSTVAAPTIPPMQPLPPAISVSTPNSDVFEQGNGAPVMRQPLPQAASRSDDQRRLLPPGSIPNSRPIDLRAEASASASDRTSVADDVMSAAKSMFHAVIPR